MIKRSIQYEDIIFVNIYVPNIKTLKYLKQILTVLKGKTDSNTVTVGNFHAPFTPMDRSY